MYNNKRHRDRPTFPLKITQISSGRMTLGDMSTVSQHLKCVLVRDEFKQVGDWVLAVKWADDRNHHRNVQSTRGV